MSDNNGHGGSRKGAGRKPKALEQDLLAKLSPFEDDAIEALKKGVESGKNWAIKLYFEYKYGKAKEHKEIDLNTDGMKITIGE